ncbi:AAA family ATPase [Tepidibacillus infernus]|uniref:ATPase n=1 Tax=Tepidibacillus decaturensis TaxID=1413211 RepID=A0A135L3W7_9BACI|nr:AAA family ATPase [Tepidibacillus decaturensis]KXG43607.1 ATPase [Tepidibacillus decaturensis]
MAKHIFWGIIPALFIFFAFIGLNIGPLLFLTLIGGLAFYLTEKKGGIPGLHQEIKKKNHIVGKTIVTFEDIGGLERTKQELKEALDFLIHSEEMKEYGIRPLKGILMDGPPGTGKTLLAKAAADYTGSVFVASSGSEFIEMYVGVGAQRVRDLFKEAKTLAKKQQKNSAIIFIDEIDVIGGKRDANSQREYDQTLNQLLTEMDGIQSRDQPQILVIAATNRKDMLDPALLRPGRFDRHILVDLPDKNARKKILEIHTSNKPLASDVDLNQIAIETYQFSGAQLESVANEAAIYAMRDKSKEIKSKHFSSAIDKVIMGEQMDRTASQQEKRRVAIHELGHAIVAENVKPGSISQVALRPRGQALGYVRHNPQEEQYLHTRESLEQQIMIALGGSVAEEIFYGHRSTGSKNDFEQALNLVNYLIDTGLTSLGIVNTNYISKDKLEKESNEILNLLLQKTSNLLQSHKEVIVKALEHLENEEVLSGNEFREMIRQLSNETMISQIG